MSLQQDFGRKQIKNYEILRTIGKGGFGTVYLCEDKITREKFAIKEIKEHSKMDPKKEIEIHTKLANKKSNRVVKIFADFTSGGFVYLVMEYCKEGSLRDYVKKNKAMEVLLATDVITQLCDALRLMHEEGIAHRDLTPNNVLIWEIIRGKNNDKVTDFGLSKEAPKGAVGQFKTTLGTLPFMAPEVKAGKFYGKAADVYSLGSTFYFLLTGKYLPEELGTILSDIMAMESVKKLPEELGKILSGVMAMDSVKKLDSTVQNDLKAFFRGMLCTEENRIKLEEIDSDNFMKWFYAERYEIDPELKDLCSHSQSGAHGRRRYSRSHSRDSLNRPIRQELPKKPNKDSALGSDQSHSGSRCRHPQFDPNSGRCKTCPFRFDSTSNTLDTAHKPRLDLNELHLSEPIPMANRFLVDRTNRPLKQKQTTNALTVRTDPSILPRNAIVSNEENIYTSKQSPWPFPIITHDFTTVNEYGRCIFKKYAALRGQLQLVAILEKVASKGNQTIREIFELWQNEFNQQELRIFEPYIREIPKPERNALRIKTGNEIVPSIRSRDELRNCKVAKEGYETLWGFLKLLSSKVVQAYCEEVARRKYRIELCMNGWANLYIGPKESKDISELKLVARQKSEGTPFEENKCDIALQNDERVLVEELAATLRAHFKASVWKSQKFDGRNIRCTVYTRAYR